MVKKVVDTSIILDLGTDTRDEQPLVVIEKSDDYFGSVGVTPYRVYPAAVFDVRTSAGTVERYGGQRMVLKREYVTFQNSNSAQLKYPVVGGNPYIDLDYIFDEYGNATYLSFEWDKNGNAIRTADGRNFFGAGLVEYYTTYCNWNYTPEINSLGGNMYDGVSMLFGVLLAHYKKTFVVHECTPSEFNIEGNDRLEVYRVVSKSIVAENGAWEVPPGWPDKNWNDYPDIAGYTSEPPTKNDPYMEYERVHEIGYIPPGKNSMKVETFYVAWAKPYVGTFNWRPQYVCKMIDVDNAKKMTFPSDWDRQEIERIKNKFESVLDIVDFCEIKREVKERYYSVNNPENLTFQPANGNCTSA